MTYEIQPAGSHYIDGAYVEDTAGAEIPVIYAATGERIVITVDGRPMAQLGPLGRATEPTLDDLAAAGLIEPPPAGDVDRAPDRLPAPIAMPADVGLDRLLDQIRGRR